MKKYMVDFVKVIGFVVLRVMEVIIRFIEVYVRMYFRKEVIFVDFFVVKELFDEMIMCFVGLFDEEEKEEVMKGLVGVIWIEEKKREVDKFWSILKYYEVLDECGEGVYINDIIEEVE